jgi:hypothetical protein
MAGYGIPANPESTGWMVFYGTPATPAQLKELAFYRHLATGQQRAQNEPTVRYAQTGTIRELEFPGG